MGGGQPARSPAEPVARWMEFVKFQHHASSASPAGLLHRARGQASCLSVAPAELEHVPSPAELAR
eukprot:7520471-Lingulodinium_polyedra.AAC.1